MDIYLLFILASRNKGSGPFDFWGGGGGEFFLPETSGDRMFFADIQSHCVAGISLQKFFLLEISLQNINITFWNTHTPLPSKVKWLAPNRPLQQLLKLSFCVRSIVIDDFQQPACCKWRKQHARSGFCLCLKGCSPVLAISLASFLGNHYCVVIFVLTRLKAVNVSQVLSASYSDKQRKNSLNLLHINFNISLSALRQFWKGHQLWFTLLYVEEYSTSPSSGRRQRCVTETGI